MKEAIETAPVIEAFESGDECPFCYMERLAERRAINYVIGPCASYMEPDVRAITDSLGFCPGHMKKLYDYGNSLGNALMMQTHMVELSREMSQQIEQMKKPGKRRLFSKPESIEMLQWLKKRNSTCYICNRVDSSMHRYYATFFVLCKDPEFRSKVENSKGFCMRHMQSLLEYAPKHLPNSQLDWFYDTVPALFQQNFQRVQGDLDWFVAKFDYRNAGADWKNSKDAVSRSMQKLQGLYPADPPYKHD